MDLCVVIREGRGQNYRELFMGKVKGEGLGIGQSGRYQQDSFREESVKRGF